MTNKGMANRVLILAIIFAALGAFLWFHKDSLTLWPWDTRARLRGPSWGSGNSQRIAVIENNAQTLTVLSPEKKLLCQVQGKPHSPRSFYRAERVELDEQNNLYVLDAQFRGAFEENVERILKYSPDGAFIAELYAYRYTNEDFIITKGKISAMTVYEGSLYVVRLGDRGFWLERVFLEPPEQAGDFPRSQEVFELAQEVFELAQEVFELAQEEPELAQGKSELAQEVFELAQEEPELAQEEPELAQEEPELAQEVFELAQEVFELAQGKSELAQEEPELTQGKSELARREVIAFFDYPQAFRDLRYFHINPASRRLSTVTKGGTLKQYGFSGDFIRAWPTEPFRFPWMAISDDSHRLIYTDMARGEILLIDTAGDTSLQRALPGTAPYTALNYRNESLFAARADHLLIKTPRGGWEILEEYRYSSGDRFKRISLFVLALAALLLGLYLGFLSIRYVARKQLSFALKISLLSGIGVVLGGGIAASLLIHYMHRQYNENTFLDLENISRLSAGSVDLQTLISISSAGDFESEAYRRLDRGLRTLFTQFQWKGKYVYQCLWRFQEGGLYSVYDTEYSRGTWYPVGNKAAYYQEVFKTRTYIHRLAPSAEGGGTWLFVCGPLFDAEKNILGLIETGYDRARFNEQTRSMLIQMVLMVAATAIALFFIMLECILIGEAFQANKAEYREHRAPVFHPELLRGILFFMFTANNLESATLPLYAAALYRPVFKLPQAFVLTLPFTADIIFIILAFLVVPGIIDRFGLKRLCLLGALGICMGQVLSFSAPNILYLGLAHGLIGFSTGTIVLVSNTIIAAQKSLEEVNQGFAHSNASYLAGINIGVVFGSMVAEFFSYRMVYLCASLVAALLLAITVFSSRSKLLTHIYEAIPVKKEDPEKNRGTPRRLLHFLLRPAVLGTLGLLALPYMASMSFVSYFMPLYGSGQGLQESNIGQLMLLNGLFTILCGTSLCAYVSHKIPVKGIVFGSLFLNAGAICLFSLRMTVPMLVLTIGILAVASIFAMTNIQTYYAALYKEDGSVSPATALSVYAVVENLGLGLGPLVFSFIASAPNISRGMQLFSLSAVLCLIGFMVLSRVPVKGIKIKE
ncbi:MAG: MFS transporter [Treponema sp.]|jgi:predicted MFS family arabinose efflux permease|nr:MFS transporter [Treponema sp.]